jgi:hypothetical protein
VASDQVTVAITIVAVAGTAVAGVVPSVLAARSQHKLEQQRQEHERQRERDTRKYQFNLRQYREQRRACSALLAATHHFQVGAVARYQFDAAMSKPRTPETLGAASAEAKLRDSEEERAAESIPSRWSC